MPPTTYHNKAHYNQFQGCFNIHFQIKNLFFKEREFIVNYIGASISTFKKGQENTL